MVNPEACQEVEPIKTLKIMEKIKVYTEEALEKSIVRVLKKSKFGLEERYLMEATNAEFSIFQFRAALCNLQQQGVIAYNENTESYEFVK